MRGNTTGYPQPLGIIGRESYTLTPTEGRNTTHYLIGISVAGQQKLEPLLEKCPPIFGIGIHPSLDGLAKVSRQRHGSPSPSSALARNDDTYSDHLDFAAAMSDRCLCLSPPPTRTTSVAPLRPK